MTNHETTVFCSEHVLNQYPSPEFAFGSSAIGTTAWLADTQPVPCLLEYPCYRE